MANQGHCESEKGHLVKQRKDVMVNQGHCKSKKGHGE
jgi:hypothetical protein